jgi:hypothetical protein
MFRVMEDCAWHTISEIADILGIPVEELTRCYKSLSEEGILEYEATSSKVRLGQKLRRIIKKLRAIDNTENEWKRRGAGIIIVPPGKTCQIQGVLMSNKTENSLEFEFTFSKKPNEIVISKV